VAPPFAIGECLHAKMGRATITLVQNVGRACLVPPAKYPFRATRARDGEGSAAGRGRAVEEINDTRNYGARARGDQPTAKAIKKPDACLPKPLPPGAVPIVGQLKERNLITSAEHALPLGELWSRAPSVAFEACAPPVQTTLAACTSLLGLCRSRQRLFSTRFLGTMSARRGLRH